MLLSFAGKDNRLSREDLIKGIGLKEETNLFLTPSEIAEEDVKRSKEEPYHPIVDVCLFDWCMKA